MAKIERYDGNLEAFGLNAPSGERHVFGDDATKSDSLTDNINADWSKGHSAGLNDSNFPTLQNFNALSFTISQLIAYLHQVGIANWNSQQEYHTNSYAVASDGLLYRSKVDNNTGNTPVGDTTNWEKAVPDVDLSNQMLRDSSNAIINGNSLLAARDLNNIISSGLLDKLQAGDGIKLTDTSTEVKLEVINKADVNHNHDSVYLKRNGNEFLNGYLSGGFGAFSTGGVKDWNDISNARSGNGATLLLASATNGFGGSGYYYSFCFEYSKRDGSGNLTQLAIPYSSNTAMYMRTRYQNAWSGWAKFSSDNSLVPVGTIVDFAYGNFSTPHEGFLPCNGAAVSRTTYADLFAKIGVTYGSGNGSSTFNLPNLNGLFRRSIGGSAGGLGVKQGDAIRNIIGTWYGNSLLNREPGLSVSGALYGYNSGRNSTAQGEGGTGKAIGFDASKSVPTASENRPVNMAFVPFIKY